MPAMKIPAPPEKPTPQECCGSGCVPCVYDFYYDALDKWNDQYGERWAAVQKENSSTDALKPRDG